MDALVAAGAGVLDALDAVTGDFAVEVTARDAGVVVVRVVGVMVARVVGGKDARFEVITGVLDERGVVLVGVLVALLRSVVDFGCCGDPVTVCDRSK